MTHERVSQAPFRPGFEADYDRPQPLEQDLQLERELAEGRASSSNMGLLAICIVLVLGAVFYGLSYSSIDEASTKPPPAQTEQTQPASPPPPPAARDVTTGAAANRPAPPPPAGQDEDRSAGQKQ
jgi:hypothetical protein